MIINSANVSYKTGTVKVALDDLCRLTLNDVWQKIYPIGSIYISIASTSPVTLFEGTWEEFGKGRTIVGADTSDTSFNEVEKTDESKNHSIVVGNHNHTVNTSSVGGHSHKLGYGQYKVGPGATVAANNNFGNPFNSQSSGTHTHSLTTTTTGAHTHNVNGNTGRYL